MERVTGCHAGLAWGPHLPTYLRAVFLLGSKNPPFPPDTFPVSSSFPLLAVINGKLVAV